jgi:hypothetical protein
MIFFLFTAILSNFQIRKTVCHMHPQKFSAVKKQAKQQVHYFYPASIKISIA